MLREFYECEYEYGKCSMLHDSDSLSVSRPIQSPFNGIVHVISLSDNGILFGGVSQKTELKWKTCSATFFSRSFVFFLYFEFENNAAIM